MQEVLLRAVDGPSLPIRTVWVCECDDSESKWMVWVWLCDDSESKWMVWVWLCKWMAWLWWWKAEGL